MDYREHNMLQSHMEEPPIIWDLKKDISFVSLTSAINDDQTVSSVLSSGEQLNPVKQQRKIITAVLI